MVERVDDGGAGVQQPAAGGDADDEQQRDDDVVGLDELGRRAHLVALVAALLHAPSPGRGPCDGVGGGLYVCMYV